MKKASVLFTSMLIMFNLCAQHNALKVHPFKMNARLPKIINNNNKALSDTVFYFNGWNRTGTGIDTSGNNPFLYKVQDIDTLTLNSEYTNFGYPKKAGFLFNHEVIATNDTSWWVEAISYFNSPGAANDWISFGPIKIPSSDTVTLSWKHNFPDGAYRDGYKIFVDTVGRDSIDFTGNPIYTINDNDLTTTLDTASTPYYVFYPRSTDFSAYAGKTIYLGFDHNADDMDRLLITDVLIKASPITTPTVTPTPTVTTTGIESHTDAAIVTIYPNPSSGMFTISVGTTAKTHVEVYNSMAVMVYSKDFNSLSTSLDLSNLNAGIYSVKVVSSDNNKLIIRKLMITR